MTELWAAAEVFLRNWNRNSPTMGKSGSSYDTGRLQVRDEIYLEGRPATSSSLLDKKCPLHLYGWTLLCCCFAYNGVSSQNSHLKQPVVILHTQRQDAWGGAFLTSRGHLGSLSVQVGLRTADLHGLQGDAPSTEVPKPCSSWQSPVWAKNPQHIQKSTQCHSVAPPYCKLASLLLFRPSVLTEQLSSMICPWWCSQSATLILLANRQQQMAQSR